MQTIPFSDTKIKYLGRWVSSAEYMQSGFPSSQIRLSVTGTTKIIVTADVADLNGSSGDILVTTIDGAGYITLNYITSVAETFTGERSFTITLPDTNEHEVTIKTAAGASADQFAGTWYIRVKTYQIDDGSTLNDYPLATTKIMFIGDSWVATENDWPRFISNTKYQIYPVAFGGAKASDMSVRYPYQIGSTPHDDPLFDAIVMCFGVNEFAASVTIANYKSSVSSLIDLIRKDTSKNVILVQPPRNVNITAPNYDQYGVALNELSKEKSNIIYLPTSPIWSQLGWLDAYHLNASGKVMFATYVENALDYYTLGYFGLKTFANSKYNKILLGLTAEEGQEELLINTEFGTKKVLIVAANDTSSSNIRLKTKNGIRALKFS